MFGLLTAGMTGAATLAKHTFGNPVGRMAFGALAGAGYGSLTSDAASSTGQFNDTMGGAIAGLGLGVLSTKTALRGIWAGTKRAAPMVWSGAKGTARGGYGAAKFAVRNPNAALAIGATGLGAFALSQTGASATDTRYNEQLAIQRGGTSSMSRVSWQDSTEGLTLGLHRGRHR